jgi:bacillithiol synthase
MSEARVVTGALGGSPLSRAVQAGRLDASIVMAPPAGPEAWRARAMAVGSSAGSGWLAPMREAFGGEGVAAARLERVARAGGVVVTTGQQPGLFGGPVYTWSKAIGALAMAEALERETGVPAAPVFWAATDDADYAEANHTAIVEGDVVRVLATAAQPAVGTPMAGTPLGAVEPLLERLRAACGSMANERAYTAVSEAYHARATVGGAYVQLLRALLDPLGVAVLDGSHPAVQRAGAGLLRLALERAHVVDAALVTRGAWLATHDFEPQVPHVPGLSTVFVREGGTKQRAPLTAAASLAVTALAETLSPNVLLRPVLERAVLPTVCYLGGPGELAYFAQVSAVAGALGAEEPLAVARWSCTIVEPAVDRALGRLGVGLDDLDDADGLERLVAGGSVPGAVRGALNALRDAIEGGLAEVARADGETTAGALLRSEVIEGAQRQLGFRLDRLERRLVAAAKRRGSEALRDLRLAQAFTRPGGRRQERTLNFIPFLARHGDALWRAMRSAAIVHATDLVGGRVRRGG